MDGDISYLVLPVNLVGAPIQNELEQLCLARDTRLAEIEAERAQTRPQPTSSKSESGSRKDSSDPSAPAPAPSTTGSPMKVELVDTRQDTPEVTNEVERDEDAVEY